VKDIFKVSSQARSNIDIPLADVSQVFVALSSAEGYKFRLDSVGPDPLEPSMQLVSYGVLQCEDKADCSDVARIQSTLGTPQIHRTGRPLHSRRSDLLGDLWYALALH
jgi:hypothetical protein